MDLAIVDVTDLPEDRVRVGDPVELFGGSIDLDDFASRSGTIGYHLLTSLGPRYQREYVRKPADVRPVQLTRNSTASTRADKYNQANPSKTNQDQIRPSKIAWFYLVLFVRIGAFQWVTANPNKNLSCPCHTVPQMSQSHSRPVFPRRTAAERGFNRTKGNGITSILDSTQRLLLLTAVYRQPRPRSAGVSDHVGCEDRGEAARGGHCSGTPALRMPSKMGSSWARNVGSSLHAVQRARAREMV